MGYTYELGPAYSGSARPRAVKDRRPHTAPVTSEPRLNRARDHCRRALKHYRAADQSAALFDFHASVKNKNIRPISDRPFCFSATELRRDKCKYFYTVFYDLDHITA